MERGAVDVVAALTTTVAAALCAYLIRQRTPALLLSMLASLGLLIFFDLGAPVGLLFFYFAVSIITAGLIHLPRHRAQITLGLIRIGSPRPDNRELKGLPAQITKMGVAAIPGALALGLGLFANFDNPPGNLVIVALSLLAIVPAALCAYFFRQRYVVIPLTAVGVLLLAFIFATNDPLSIDLRNWILPLLLTATVSLAVYTLLTKTAE